MPNIIVVSRRLRSPLTFRIDGRRQQALLAAGAASALALIAGLGWWGGVAASSSDAALAPIRAEVAESRAAVDDARADARREVNAMAARLGELQAQANRLNALGQRLTRLGDLKDGEFDFNDRPGMGGPDTAEGRPPELSATLGSLEERFSSAERQLDVLGALLEGERTAGASKPQRMPAPGYISSGFGIRADPFTGARSHHLGIDIDARTGDPITAAADGIVAFSGIKTGYGNVVIIDHGNGYETLYAHNQSNGVRAGDVVRAGAVIGKVGSSGRSTGSHLHFEVHVNGRPVNPTAYLKRIRG